MNRRAVAALVGGLAASGAFALARRLPERLQAPFARTNHAGRSVTLLEGPAWVLGATAAAALSSVPAAAATLASGALGALDDLAGDGSSKGLKGHLGAAARGEITTGFVKIVGLGASGVATAWASERAAGHRGIRAGGSALLGGALVAGTANLLNLFDLRPGRALKVTLLVAVPLALTPGEGGVQAAAASGAALALLPPDLRGEAMLGDTGANAAGALLGTALLHRSGPVGRAVALAVVVGLTLASEKVSFSRVIDRTPVLRALDRWGRA